VKLIIDSQSLIWTVDDPATLSQKAILAIQDRTNDLLLSAATIWEIAIKVGLKKLTLSLPLREWMDRAIADLGVLVLPITLESAAQLVQLPYHHGDPFDRMLIAQCQVENASIVSSDTMLDRYGVRRIW
jgi:PIN domain nuclease of toxin-antitoxin system